MKGLLGRQILKSVKLPFFVDRDTAQQFLSLKFEHTVLTYTETWIYTVFQKSDAKIQNHYNYGISYQN